MIAVHRNRLGLQSHHLKNRKTVNPSVAKKQLCRECLQNLQHAVLEVLSGAEGQYELA
jgi:hypothetical protein